MAPNTNELIQEMINAHKENYRILGFVINELQGRVEAGKLAAIYNCWLRSKEICDFLEETNNSAFTKKTTTI